MLGCQSRTKTLAYRSPILLPHQLQYFLSKFHFMSMVRGPTHTAMLQPCGAPLPISLPQSLRLPVAHLQELAGIYNPQMLAPHTRQHFHPSQLPLAHLCPPQSDLLSEVLLRGHFYFGEKGTLLSWNNSKNKYHSRVRSSGDITAPVDACAATRPALFVAGCRKTFVPQPSYSGSLVLQTHWETQDANVTFECRPGPAAFSAFAII